MTLREAARIAGVSVDHPLATPRRTVRETGPAAPHAAVTQDARGPSTPKPAALSNVPESRRRYLDVREDIHRNQEPFARIMAAAKALGPDEILVLRAPFEPIPLYDVLGKLGLAHWTECRAANDWCVWFYRRANQTGGADRRERPTTVLPESGQRVLDVRGLEPPEPMVRILAELERLEPGQHIEVLHERRLTLLYPQLDERGFTHETDEPEPGVVRIIIRRGAEAHAT